MDDRDGQLERFEVAHTTAALGQLLQCTDVHEVEEDRHDDRRDHELGLARHRSQRTAGNRAQVAEEASRARVHRHGPRGLGDGPAAFTLNPRPVNLQLHVPQHAEGEIFYWISEGVAGTGMPAWKDKLTEEQRWQIVRYLEALASGRVQQ